MNVDSYLELKPNTKIPAFRTGDTVRVHVKVIEGDRERIQAFEGVVIRVRRGGANSNFTVRRISHGIGVERIFPYFSPLIDKVDVVRVGRVRRSRLYYLRDRIGKAARIKPGSRARFEALTAPGAVPEPEPEPEEEIVEEVLAEDEVIAEGEAETADAAAEEAPEGEEPAEEASAEAEQPTESATEPAAEAEPEPEASEEAAEPDAAGEPEAAAEEPAPEAADEPEAEEPAADEPAEEDAKE